MATAIVVGVGAERGVGGALCRRFASEGLHVLVGGRTPSKIEAVVDHLREQGGRATPVQIDATRSEDISRIFDAAEQAGGVPELVVYNAGNNRFSGLREMSDEFFEEVWRICCFGGFLVGREAATRMLPAGGGSLLFTGATASMRARPPFTAFASAKAALRMVAHGMAREFGGEGLHVGHVVIDGDRINERMPAIKERLGAEGMLQVDDIASAFWMLHTQPKSSWTLELDIRPFKESF
ncbi:MAG: SDR family NAD(P)-dependent oxidoreductase [bacterium]|nr:SDR family NAD(P)-dependent oxidoreductase [bacterium]